ncbi:MAG: hypothetical protein OEW12_07210 [Deltaproteobacteria bacterium]|nr:hypothetical protein [Deltaproteobacteria bacterium]
MKPPANPGHSGQPSPEALRRAKESWKQCLADIKAAASHLKKGDGVRASFLCLQGGANALGMVCRLNGHTYVPLVSPQDMVTMCADIDPRFTPLQGGLAALEQAMSINPFSLAAAPPAAEECLREARQIVDTVREYLHQHRDQLFKP